MAQDRQNRISDLYHRALARPAEERRGFLAEVCAGDAEPSDDEDERSPSPLARSRLHGRLRRPRCRDLILCGRVCESSSSRGATRCTRRLAASWSSGSIPIGGRPGNRWKLLMALNCDSGEPPRNRTENPQIERHPGPDVSTACASSKFPITTWTRSLMRAASRFFPAFLLTMVTVGAQSPSLQQIPRDTKQPVTGTARLSGRVVAADANKALVRAVVQLVTAGRTAAVDVDGRDGRWQFSRVPGAGTPS